MNKLPILIYLVVIFTCVIVPARAAELAPFGLSWGASKEQAEALGVQLTAAGQDENGKNFVAKNLPKILSDIKIVILSFGFNNQLHRVAAIGKNIDNDPYGSEVKKRYQSLSRLLTKKYGKGDVNHHQDTKVWTDADDFLMGLKQRRSWHYTDFARDNITIRLGIHGSSRDSGSYILIYQDEDLKKRVKEDSNQNEEGAL